MEAYRAFPNPSWDGGEGGEKKSPNQRYACHKGAFVLGERGWSTLDTGLVSLCEMSHASVVSHYEMSHEGLDTGLVSLCEMSHASKRVES